MEPLPGDESKSRAPLGASFDPQTGFVLVNINKIDYGFMDKPVRYQGKVFQPKSELHITIVSQDAAERVRQYLESHPDDAHEFQDLISSTNWSYLKKQEFYYVEEEPGVETLIQMVEVPSLNAFFSSLSSIVGKGFILPPTHVTLYTRGTEKGIGLPNQETFQERAKAAVQPGEIRAEDDPPARLGSDQGLAR